MSRAWKQHWLAVPGVGVSLLPKLACPACWPAYAGLLSSLGLGFLISTVYLLPLTAMFLFLALVALGFKARQRYGFGPFLLGLAGALGVLLGKFLLRSDITMYGAVGLLVVASLWNAWPHQGTSSARTAGTDCQSEKIGKNSRFNVGGNNEHKEENRNI
jgi:mercuric ion transport protein